MTLKFVKVISAILMTQRTENEAKKDNKQIKLEEDHLFIMVVEISVH